MVKLMYLRNLIREIDSIIERDPAAGSRLGVVLLYPSFHVIFFYRFANFLWRYNLNFFARLIMQFARILTGIEIHPAAKIGKNIFMDHGFGIVIGETAEIGNDVTIYQGVTLGGIMPSVETNSQRNQKRHPTIGDGVIIGSGAQILGPIKVGNNVRIGANSVVSREILPDLTVAGVPAREFNKSSKNIIGFKPYGFSRSDIDPHEKTLSMLIKRIDNLEKKINFNKNKSKG